jgi:hypothetical protein
MLAAIAIPPPDRPPVIATLIAAVLIAGYNRAFSVHLQQPRMAALHRETDRRSRPPRAAPSPPPRDHRREPSPTRLGHEGRRSARPPRTHQALKPPAAPPRPGAPRRAASPRYAGRAPAAAIGRPPWSAAACRAAPRPGVSRAAGRRRASRRRLRPPPSLVTRTARTVVPCTCGRTGPPPLSPRSRW